MIARVPIANSTIAVRTINNGLCIATSTNAEFPRPTQLNYRGSNEPTVNVSYQGEYLFYDVICAMIVVIAMPVANAKARAMATKMIFTEIPFSQTIR
jgi:hypothetical protein